MIWRLRRHEPSFSSMNEKSFESRRVRTQPWTWTPEIGASLARAALTEVGPDIGQLCRAMPVRQAKAHSASLNCHPEPVEGSLNILAANREEMVRDAST